MSDDQDRSISILDEEQKTSVNKTEIPKPVESAVNKPPEPHSKWNPYPGFKHKQVCVFCTKVFYNSRTPNTKSICGRCSTYYKQLV